ncbi:hypothetical protein JQC91_05590 [Jannaschia sp. Os4]|uniref:hypothetical protein n=1 Tax=Jannaschia sp. Os4 TaxID=2807617 RepID=UPI00193962F2|nr:hypothetical protein [Jannaschia sp. Os4]MBM2575773.1 hypothetical protein [Jannaschia sp. Os4]
MDLKPFLAPSLAFAAFVGALAAAPFALAYDNEEPAIAEERIEQITDQDVDGDGCIMEGGVCVGAQGD